MTGPFGAKILEHFRHPRNRGTLPSPAVSQEGTNPLCGDRVRIELALDGDVIIDARFTANACAVCVASASVLTELIRGAALEDVATLTVPEVLAELDTELPAARLGCVKLPLTVLHAGIQLYAQRGG